MPYGVYIYSTLHFSQQHVSFSQMQRANSKMQRAFGTTQRCIWWGTNGVKCNAPRKHAVF